MPERLPERFRNGSRVSLPVARDDPRMCDERR